MYYAYNRWYSPTPVPAVASITPVRTSSAASLDENLLIGQAMLYLYGELI